MPFGALLGFICARPLQVNELKEAFEFYDKDGDKALSKGILLRPRKHVFLAFRRLSVCGLAICTSLTALFLCLVASADGVRSLSLR